MCVGWWHRSHRIIIKYSVRKAHGCTLLIFTPPVHNNNNIIVQVSSSACAGSVHDQHQTHTQTHTRMHLQCIIKLKLKSNTVFWVKWNNRCKLIQSKHTNTNKILPQGWELKSDQRKISRNIIITTTTSKTETEICKLKKIKLRNKH